MRLGLVAVVLVAACGPAPEQDAESTAPVRIARLTVDQHGVNASSSTVPLELKLRVWADGVAAGSFDYRGLPDPFAEIGAVNASAKHWRVVADYRDEDGQHSIDREAQLSGTAPLESLLLCLCERESAVVLIGQPLDRVAPATSDVLPAPLQAMGFDTPHTDYDWTGGPFNAELHDRIHWDATTWAEARAEGLLEPGLYHLELRSRHSTLVAPAMVQVDQYAQTDDFAIQ